MKITWYGHSCFKIKCKNFSLLIDPYDKSIGLSIPRIKADIVLITHQHRDHNNVKVVIGKPFIIDSPGEYEVKGAFIYGKEAFHDNKDGAERGVITMYLIEEEKVRIAHLGDLGQKQLTEEQLEFLNNVDVLLIPVGGVYTVNGSEAANLVNEIEPRVVTPMHYKVPGLNLNIEKVDSFVKEIGLTPEKTDEFKVTADTLPTSELKLVIFNKQ